MVLNILTLIIKVLGN